MPEQRVLHFVMKRAVRDTAEIKITATACEIGIQERSCCFYVLKVAVLANNQHSVESRPIH